MVEKSLLILNMPEYYKKVVCLQFLLSEEDKEQITKGIPIHFEGQLVRQTGTGRFHILFPLGDRLVPVHETDWIVRNPEVEIKRDHEFRSQYISFDNIDPIALREKFETYMKDRNH